MTKRFDLRKLKRAYVLAVAVLAGAGLLTASCSGSGIPTSPSGSANLRLMLTDAPIPGVEQVNIYFTSVTVKAAGQPPQELALQLQTNPVDLLTLDDQVVGFATGVVTPGDVEWIRINIDASMSNLMFNGVETALRVPSEEIKILGGFAVDANHLTTLTLDFDAAASLVSLGNGEWLLKPVVILAGNTTTSS